MKNYDDIMKELGDAYEKCPEMPESLSKENIVKKIKENNVEQEPKKTGFGIEMIAAAVAVVAVIGVMAGTGRFSSDVKKENIAQDVAVSDAVVTEPVHESATEKKEPEQQDEATVQGVHKFDSEESVENYFVKIFRENGAFNGYYYYGYNDTMTGIGVTAAPGAAPEGDLEFSDSALKTEPTHGTTNVQTEGVDEGDIIKNDGRYLYFVSGTYEYEQRLKIFDTQSMTVVYSGIIGERTDESQSTIHELYVNGNTMTVIYAQDRVEKDGDTEYLAADCTVEVYDITNKASPKKTDTLVQDGRFVSSRMIGDVLYTVSSYQVLGKDEESIIKYCFPKVNHESVGCKDIYFFDEDSTAYTVITALDTSSADAEETSLAILGRANEIYSSAGTLYYFETKYEEDTEKTVITSFSLDKTDVKLKASGEVRGRYNNNYSFDEYKGYLRCATTSYDIRSYKDVSNIYVLNDKLEIVGSCENISDNEQVKSVRFMGDKGYVVTFRNTDPLFSLDLSDPKNPKITGELKLPGYSTYLHPLGNDLLMGIGYDGDEENADTSSLKVALFDISDMTKPTLLDEYVIKKASSESNYEPKALVHFSDKKLIGIPVSSYSYTHNGEYMQYRSFAIIGYNDNKLSEVTGFLHDTKGDYSSFFRGTYIEDRLYTVDSLKVVEHNLSDGEKLREAVVVSESEKITHEESEVTKYGGIIDMMF